MSEIQKYRDCLCYTFLCCGVLLALSWGPLSADASAAEPAGPEAKYTPEPEIADLIQQAAGKDQGRTPRILEQLTALGAPAERALNYYLNKETTAAGRIRYAELVARCNFGRVGYRVILELQPDGSGNVTLWSDRTLLAECCKRNAQINHEPEPVFKQEDLMKNPFSKVDLIKHIGENLNYLEGRVATRENRIEAAGALRFTNFDAFKTFADSFDASGYYLIGGTTLSDRRQLRTLRYKMALEEDPQTFQNNILLYHNVRWEYVLDFKGIIEANNATRTDGSKLIWSFNCSQMLKGEAVVEASFSAEGLSPRPQAEESAVQLNANAQSHLPVAVVSKREISVRAYNRAPNTPKATAKELRDKGYLVELDGHNSIPCPVRATRGEDEDQPSQPVPPLQFLWAQTSGDAELKLPTEELRKDHLGFIVKDAGEYHFSLTVTQRGLSSKPVEVKIIVTADPIVAAPKIKTPTASVVAVEPAVLVEKIQEAPQPLLPKESAIAKVADTNPNPEVTIKPNPSVIPTTPTVSTTATPIPATKDPVQNPPAPVAPVAAAPTAPPPPDKAPVEAPVNTVEASKSKELYAKGLTQFKAGDYANACKSFETVCKAAPEDVECKYDLGMALMELGNYRTAQPLFEAVTESNSPRRARAFMNSGHCYFRTNRPIDARNCYKEGTALDKNTVYWEIAWQQGNKYLTEKDYESALSRLKRADQDAAIAKLKDFRLLRDMAIALHMTGQNAEALKHLEALTALGYTPDAQLLADVKTDKTPVERVSDATKIDPLKSAVAKAETPKITPPPPEPAALPAAIDPVKKEEPKVTHTPSAIVSVPAAVKTEEPKKELRGTPAAVSSNTPKKSNKPEKRRIPTVPKKPLPPILTDFSEALAAGKKSLNEGEQILEHSLKDKSNTAEKIEEARIQAAQSFDEAEAMLRGAWSQKPADPAVVEAFERLSKRSGAIALAKNVYITAKVRGLIILDAEPSIAPKDKADKPKPLYYAWEQVDGEELDLRPEDMASKKVKVKIPKAGLYKFDLSVSDGARGGNPVTVTVEVVE